MGEVAGWRAGINAAEAPGVDADNADPATRELTLLLRRVLHLQPGAEIRNHLGLQSCLPLVIFFVPVSFLFIAGHRPERGAFFLGGSPPPHPSLHYVIISVCVCGAQRREAAHACASSVDMI